MSSQNRSEMPEEQLYKSIDGNTIKNPVAYCKSHKGYLSLKQLKVHRCTSRCCIGLEKLDCPHWRERNRRRELSKQKRKELYGR